MNATFLLVLFIVICLVLMATMMLIQPFIVRRGLLFGVYVGENTVDGREAKAIRRQWVVSMVATFGASLLLGIVLLALQVGPLPLAPLAAIVALGAGTYAVYLRAYFKARRLAVEETLPAAAALVGAPRYANTLPLVSVGVGLLGGLVALAYALANYTALPAQVPTHFGASGRPDAWSPKSFASVMVLPLGTLLMGTSTGLIAWLVARAKRAIRYPAGASVTAQQRFRQVSANLLAAVGILMTLMMTVMSIYSVRTALGLAEGLPLWLIALVIALLVASAGGSLYIAVRYGQGGARLEKQAASSPLTNGLADNSRWVLGAFYVNREDPSILVEKRFGLGYTINFGNPKALALLLLFLAMVAAIVVSGLTMSQTSVRP